MNDLLVLYSILTIGNINTQTVNSQKNNQEQYSVSHVTKATVNQKIQYVNFENESLTLKEGNNIFLEREKKIDYEKDIKDKSMYMPSRAEVEKLNKEGSIASQELRKQLKMKGPVLYSNISKNCKLAFIPHQNDDISSLTLVSGVVFESSLAADQMYLDFHIDDSVIYSYQRIFSVKRNGHEVGRAQMMCGFVRSKSEARNLSADLKAAYLANIKQAGFSHKGDTYRLISEKAGKVEVAPTATQQITK